LALDLQRALLTFYLADTIAALPLESVEVVVPMAQLAGPPGLPAPIEGILNLAGIGVPILRLGWLLKLPVRGPGLYSRLIILKGLPGFRLALLVDRVIEILSVPEGDLLPATCDDTFHACSEAAVSVRGRMVHLLSPSQILPQKEREILSEYSATGQWRLQHWKAAEE
jgi:purine-binding chemotaxis protein CheW